MKLLIAGPVLAAILLGTSTSMVVQADTGMASMAGHMVMTDSRPAGANDATRARGVVDRARAAMEPYKDYRKALADGYQIFLPNIPEPQYHFTKYQYGLEVHRNADSSRDWRWP
jgi:hypothetical protein